MDLAQHLRTLAPEQPFFIGIDSDGCVFDSMEVKHKECFCPAFIKHYGLQSVSRYGREVWEFVNLYSKSRGCNRFVAIQRALRLAAQRPVFAARGVRLPDLAALDAWIARESKLGNPALRAAVAATPDPELTRSLAWSEEVNARVEDMVFGVGPFSPVLPALRAMAAAADVIVVSQTPWEALDREWREHGMDRHVRAIAGQEAGTKTEHLALAAGGKYGPDRVMMIGDAPGDAEAAVANRALFFPIVPGHEEASWTRWLDEGLPRFLAGTYAGDYQRERRVEFDKALPDAPHWD
jgi:phosphoglycolate phosphatase-like HAD superfamily hydrolase